jgi:phage virion morphogenesis protein
VLTITYDDASVTEVVAKALKKTKDLTPASELVGEYMLGQIDNRFRTETDPQRVPWQPLSPRTLALKQAEGKIQKILQRTGLMRSTANYKARPKSLVVGLSSSIAAKHQQGKGVPKREILGLNKEDIRHISEIYQDFLLDL